jgi:hypothetical protein
MHAGDDPAWDVLSDDLLEGSEAIAKFLGDKWSASRVRKAKYRQHLPIHKRPGIGLYAFKSELTAFLRAAESLARPIK